MERFVRLVVAGGLATLAGLWVAAFATPDTVGWGVGLLAAVLGLALLGAGVRRSLQREGSRLR